MKILIVHASAGAGHKKAAEALYDALKDNPKVSATLVDILDYTGFVYKTTYRNTYTLLVTKAASFWAVFFYLTDISFLRPFIRWIRRIANALNSRPFEEFLIKEQFDLIISTHFFPNEVASYLKRKKLIASRIISVITDFDVHSMWVADGINLYTVACDFTKKCLVSLGVKENLAIVTGIPTHKKFSQAPPKEQIQNKLGLQKNIFTILVATGSFGMGPIEELVEGLKDYQVLVVCGNNKELFQRLSPKNSNLLKVYGLVNNMEELMSVSDAMVTKPGGLSISEALVKNLPLVFFSAIPGQESNNIKVLREYGIGKDCRRIEEIVDEIKKISSMEDFRRQLKNNIQKLAQPAAVANILKPLV